MFLQQLLSVESSSYNTAASFSHPKYHADDTQHKNNSWPENPMYNVVDIKFPRPYHIILITVTMQTHKGFTNDAISLLVFMDRVTNQAGWTFAERIIGTLKPQEQFVNNRTFNLNFHLGICHWQTAYRKWKQPSRHISSTYVFFLFKQCYSHCSDVVIPHC